MLLFRKGHLPYGTADGPAAYIVSDLLDYELMPEGQGTSYPIAMSLEEYCACFYRVKAWRLTGSVTVERGDPAENYWEGTHEFDLLFERPVENEQQILTLGKEISSTNTARRRELFGSSPLTDSFFGTHFLDTQNSPQTATADFSLTVDFCPPLDQETGFFAVGDSQETEGQFAVAFRMLISVEGEAVRSQSGTGNPVVSSVTLTASTNGTNGTWSPNTQATGSSIATITIDGPFETAKTVNLYLGSGTIDGLSFADLTLQPAEWFTYDIRGSGPLYDSETGAFL